MSASSAPILPASDKTASLIQKYLHVLLGKSAIYLIGQIGELPRSLQTLDQKFVVGFNSVEVSILLL